MRTISPRRLAAALLAWVALSLPPAMAQTPAEAEAPGIRLKIVGGLADVSQYVRYEEPFWRRRITEMTNGRVQAEIAPFDRSGIRGQEMLQLMRLGVVPFGTALLAIVSTEEPEFNAVDLPALAPDMASLRQTVAAFRPHIEQVLRERYQIELLGIYTYPAQVVFCTRAFAGLADLAGRRIRSSSVGQSEMLQALGATPVVIPFAEVAQALRGGVVECAITGTLSGNAIGLHEITTHVHAMALAWGISIFGANATAWAALPGDIRQIISGGIRDLEHQIWAAADRETGEGLACNAGRPGCTAGRPGNMTVVPVSAADDERRRRLLTEVVLPRWVNRCGLDCVDAWNAYLAPALGIQARPE
ncbi:MULTISPECIES: TRAP transporter substrate-binding protein [Roseomonadaceae]|uniref:TRAP transporter substrate-binding protein n=1 Tax=Falsiroseomonas oleicola TaxID=2801474 RepID=A0ABS6H8N5_9PROT|nr:TRAP transporter substrate-binding protein [Roseomonas oleicola]MBU8545079.1 TRAP transporter substrate-binding protein [Roseomonas oleicola]